jgi:hypothetical protein
MGSIGGLCVSGGLLRVDRVSSSVTVFCVWVAAAPSLVSPSVARPVDESIRLGLRPSSSSVRALRLPARQVCLVGSALFGLTCRRGAGHGRVSAGRWVRDRSGAAQCFLFGCGWAAHRSGIHAVSLPLGHPRCQICAASCLPLACSLRSIPPYCSLRSTFPWLLAGARRIWGPMSVSCRAALCSGGPLFLAVS